MVQKSYILLLVVAMSLSYGFMLQSNILYGDIGMFNVELSHAELFSVYLINLMLLIFFYWIYKILVSIEFQKQTRLRFRFRKKRFDTFVFVLLICQIVFLHYTGVGRILSDATSIYSPVFAMLSPSFLIFIYYLFSRDSTSVIFWVNILLYFTLELSKGWTGFLLIFMFLELHFFFKDKILNIRTKLIVVLSIVIFIIFIGALVYKFLFPLKMEIRGQGSYQTLEYSVSIEKLTSRLTFFPVSVAAVQAEEEIELIFFESAMPFKEIVGFLRPLTPSFLFDKTSFNSLNNDVLRAFKPDITVSTSTDLGFFSYAYLLSKIDLIQFLFYLLVLSIMLLLLTLSLNILLGKKGNILLFFIVMSVYYTVSLEVVFADFFGFLLFILPLLFILKILRVYRVKRIVGLRYGG